MLSPLRLAPLPVESGSKGFEKTCNSPPFRLADFHLGGHFRRDACVEPNVHREITRVADVGDVDFALFNLHAVLLVQRVGNLLRGHRTIELAALRAASRDADDLAADFLADLFRLGTLDILAVLLRGFGVLDGVQIGRVRFTRQSLGEKEIAGVSVGRLDDLIVKSNV